MSDQAVLVKDLIVLVADKDMEQAILAILSRPKSLVMRQISFQVLVDSTEHDPGCFHRSHELLRSQQARFSHALVVFDLHGCGQESQSREQLETTVEGRLGSSGWTHAACICIDPELENWVWIDSPHVANRLGWSGS